MLRGEGGISKGGGHGIMLWSGGGAHTAKFMGSSRSGELKTLELVARTVPTA